MKIFLFSLLVLFSMAVKAQRYIWSPDSLSQDDPNFMMDRYHDILRYHDPYMYLTYPVVKPIVERRSSLIEGEGKNSYWAEGNFANRFVIYKGKYYNYPVFQRTRFTFDVALTQRLTRDYSNPLLPANNKFGLGLDFLLSNRTQLAKEKASLAWTTLQLHHYSNGQSDSFFIKGPVKRNNYRSGDFSTNYYRIMLNVAGSSQQTNIVSGFFGYQREINLRGPLALSQELQHYYGYSRLLFGLQWMQKPRIVTMNYSNRATTETDTIKVDRRKQFGFRTELEYILGNLSAFEGPGKSRLGWHVYFTFMPSVTNEVGLMVHSFLGRDYLNIRFDDVVFIGEIGMYVKLNAR